MDTEVNNGDGQVPSFLTDLADADWTRVLDAVSDADTWLREATPGAPDIDRVAKRLAGLASHPKWEVRRAVAVLGSHCMNAAFDGPLAHLTTDDNSRVRRAAQQAIARRRDGRQASTLAKGHEDRINAILEHAEARFGSRVRESVKRVSEEIANIYTRELYHETVKLLTPLALSAERIEVALRSPSQATAAHSEVLTLARQVRHLKAVLDAMREYAKPPRLTFASEEIRGIVEDAWALAQSETGARAEPHLQNNVRSSVLAEVCRHRLLQAFRNLFANAIESYPAGSAADPVTVDAAAQTGFVQMTIKDRGCGMTKESVVDARKLFSTTKSYGTGFGLPLAIKIIDSEHRGRLRIESEIGHGTQIELIIPAHHVVETT